MATDAENLRAAKSSLLAKIAAVSASPKLSYSIDGQSVDHNAYRRSLLAEVGEIDKLIQAAQGPFELHTEMR